MHKEPEQGEILVQLTMLLPEGLWAQDMPSLSAETPPATMMCHKREALIGFGFFEHDVAVFEFPVGVDISAHHRAVSIEMGTKLQDIPIGESLFELRTGFADATLFFRRA